MLALFTSQQPQPGAGALSGMGCKVASTLEEWRDAYRLVYRSYRRAGLSEPRRSQLRVTPYHLLPTTSTLVAQFESTTIGTLTLIRDSDAGVPLEAVYEDEINQARDAGVAFAEVSCLATEHLPARDYLYVFVRLMRLVAQHARFLGTERLVIATHPRHVAFYERFMGFRKFGSRKNYPAVRGAPAVAAYLDFAQADRERPPFYDDCFGVRVHEEALRARPMPPDVAAYFAPFTAPLEVSEFAGEGVTFGRAARSEPVEAGCC